MICRPFTPLLLLAWTAAAQTADVDTLRKELLDLKQEYANKIRSLEDKLNDIEQRQTLAARQGSEAVLKAQESVDRSVAALNIAQENRKALQTLGTTPLFDAVGDETKKAFEFHGYARSGFGLNGFGGQQVAFHAPSAPAKYRLGNEVETYAELVFVNNWLSREREPDKAWFKTEFLVMASTLNLNNYDPSTVYKFREAYGQGGNLLPGRFQKVRFWAGQRYYMRQQIYINDFWFLDMSGYGGGVEDIPMPRGKAAVAYIASATPTSLTTIGNVPKSNIDARWTEIPALGGKIGLWYNFATTKIGNLNGTTMAIPSTTGQNFGFEHRLDEIVGGYNVLTVQTGRGAAANLLATFDPPTPYWRDSRTLLITESALFQPTEKFAIQPAFVARWQKPGDPGVGFGEWYSIGARPQYNFNKYLGIAFEAGLDYVGDPKNEYAGWLRKYTIAPLITNGYGFFARPQIRAFFTYAEWSNALKGRIGGDVYKNRTSGISAGVQFEAWW